MENLLLLHGALGTAALFDDLKQKLHPYFRVHTLDFSGHGGLALPPEPFSMALFSADILNLMERKHLQKVSIVGYSMGGYAALCFALQHPAHVQRIFTLATKFNWTPETASKESKLLQPEKIAEKLPKFAAILAQRHAPQDWKQVMGKTTDMMHGLGQQPPLTPETLAMLQLPVQLAVGDSDAMVSVQETYWAYTQLPQASLLVLPNTPHPFEKVAVPRLVYEIRQFMQPQSV